MEILTDNVECIILSAGLSSRMGTHKALLQYDNKHSFITKIIEIYKEAGINKIHVISNPDLAKNLYIENVNIIINDKPEYERFYSVKLGCANLNHGSIFCFIQNCDNPFLKIDLINQLLENISDADYAVPVFYDRGGHPILIGKKIIDHIKSLSFLQNNLREVLSSFNIKKIDVDDENVLLNINTLEEYNKYFLNAHD